MYYKNSNFIWLNTNLQEIREKTTNERNGEENFKILKTFIKEQQIEIPQAVVVCFP